MIYNSTLGLPAGSSRSGPFGSFARDLGGSRFDQDSSKGGAVETGCSDLYDVMY